MQRHHLQITDKSEPSHEVPVSAMPGNSLPLDLLRIERFLGSEYFHEILILLQQREKNYPPPQTSVSTAVTAVVVA